MKITRPIPEAVVASISFSDRVQELAWDDATSLVASGEPAPKSVEDIQPGAAFVIPVLIPEGVESGDARTAQNGAIDTRNFPIPLYWQVKTASGHDGSVIVGRIDSAEPLPEGGIGNARGVFDVGPFGREAQRLVHGLFLRGVSADLDNFEATVDTAGADELADSGKGASKQTIKSDPITITRARVSAATLTGKPAFQECTIELEPAADELDREIPVEDGVYEDINDDDTEALAAALTAAAAPLVPPRDWFTNPKFKELTPITVTEDGRVFGHIASWKVNHIGYPRAQKPPRSASNYAYFRTGVLRTTEGDVPVGQLTLAGGHAAMELAARDAVKHYDDTASAVADVSAGEDQFGIWVAGGLRPDVTPEQVRVLRASAPSGDWRSINGHLELVAICQVNVPGFPVARSMVASGMINSLVAAGARPIAELRVDRVAQLEDRLAGLEAKETARVREAALKNSSLGELIAAEAEEAELQMRKHQKAKCALDELVASSDREARDAASAKIMALED